jgi:hypothetical protein
LFARTFGIHTKSLDLGNPSEVVSFIGKSLRTDLVGRRPFRFLFFADCDKELKKIVFYDMSCLEHVIEFSSLLSRFPGYSVTCDGVSEIKIHHFDSVEAVAKVMTLVVGSSGLVSDVCDNDIQTEDETKSLRTVASMTHGFLDVATDLCGTVIARIVEDDNTKERFPFFTIKFDAKSKDNRSVVRSCEKMYFAWSDHDVNYMILICRFKMLPPFAMSFPIMGKGLEAASQLYMSTKKGVGMTMYTDDVSDTFRITDSKPTFEAPSDES